MTHVRPKESGGSLRSLGANRSWTSKRVDAGRDTWANRSHPRGAPDVRDEELADPQSRRLYAPGSAEEEGQTTSATWIHFFNLQRECKYRL